MKQFRALLMVTALAAISFASTAQTRVKNVASVTQGYTVEFAGVSGTPIDSLQVSDSIGYIIPVSHLNDVNPYFTLNWLKIGAGTATLGVNFLQSMDGVTYNPIPKGVNNVAYTKTYTLSAAGTTQNNASFYLDSARFEGRYMKIVLFTTSTATVKGKLDCLLKPTIR